MSDQNTYEKKKVDAEELAKALEQLPDEDKFKIYYMIKGIELINERDETA